MVVYKRNAGNQGFDSQLHHFFNHKQIVSAAGANRNFFICNVFISDDIENAK